MIPPGSDPCCLRNALFFETRPPARGISDILVYFDSIFRRRPSASKRISLLLVNIARSNSSCGQWVAPRFISWAPKNGELTNIQYMPNINEVSYIPPQGGNSYEIYHILKRTISRIEKPTWAIWAIAPTQYGGRSFKSRITTYSGIYPHPRTPPATAAAPLVSFYKED